MTSSFTRTYRLPHGFAAEFGIELDLIRPGEAGPAEGFTCRWSPRFPHIRSTRARRKFLEAYTAARNDFMQDVAQMLGGTVLIADTDEHYQLAAMTALTPQVPS